MQLVIPVCVVLQKEAPALDGRGAVTVSVVSLGARASSRSTIYEQPLQPHSEGEVADEEGVVAVGED